MDGIFSSSLKLFIGWVFILTCFVLLGVGLFKGASNLDLYDLANWDGRHFLEIAQKGYTNKTQYAFFPLYPLVTRLISQIFNINYLYSAISINLVATLGTIYLFNKLLKDYQEKATQTIISFLIFPTSFYLLTIYSESLFLFLTLGTFLLAKKKQYFWAALLASLSSVTRITGIAVIAGLLVEVFLSKTENRQKLAIGIFSLLGLAIYCSFLYLKTGNPFYFLISELSWERNLAVPGTNIWGAIQYITHFGIKPESFTILSDLLFTVFGLGMAIRAVRFLNPSLAVYTLVSLFIPLATNLLLSVPRFLIVIFPIFILIPKIRNNVFKVSFVIISLVLLFLYFNFFLRNIWVS